MGNFFKKFGKGILYLFVLPFYLVFLAGFAIYGIVIFFIELVKSAIRFFSGQPLNLEFEEDILAANIDNPNYNRDQNTVNNVDNSTKTVIYINGNAQVASTNTDQIYVKSDKEQPPLLNDVVEPLPIEEQPSETENILNREEAFNEPSFNVNELGSNNNNEQIEEKIETIHNSNIIIDETEDNDEDDENGGVDLDYHDIY